MTQLWEAIAKACPEEMEVDQPESLAPLSPMPTGNSYRILELLAKRRNLKIRQIPADGNCFFHAVSASLTSVGEQNIDGPDIRQKLIDYLETTSEKQYYFGFLQRNNSLHQSSVHNHRPWRFQRGSP
ncbi:Hypothetical predicted protein [Octopus vulgaris]|uniref:OTU domain-containing protein n=1 Tax=Octopus vulgaris TaxID=6645 RepID=A0AA36APC1_OCTVU|nr:Hypothetical predicted protein [Octopus vulgaris]